jgi:hypothetical protein
MPLYEISFRTKAVDSAKPTEEVEGANGGIVIRVEADSALDARYLLTSALQELVNAKAKAEQAPVSKRWLN